MSREIKFRAWDGKRMVTPAYGLNNRGHLVWSPSYDLLIRPGYATTNDTPPLEIMQYTGLTDKNRREIYEGDIVDTPGQRGTIRYENAKFIIDFGDGYQDLALIPDEQEVIGNVYENPELLKEAA